MSSSRATSKVAQRKPAEFENLLVDADCKFVNVRLCELRFDLGLWFYHSESDRWFHWDEAETFWRPSLDAPSYWFDDRPWDADDLTISRAIPRPSSRHSAMNSSGTCLRETSKRLSDL